MILFKNSNPFHIYITVFMLVLCTPDSQKNGILASVIENAREVRGSSYIMFFLYNFYTFFLTSDLEK